MLKIIKGYLHNNYFHHFLFLLTILNSIILIEEGGTEKFNLLSHLKISIPVLIALDTISISNYNFLKHSLKSFFYMGYSKLKILLFINVLNLMTYLFSVFLSLITVNILHLILPLFSMNIIINYYCFFTCFVVIIVFFLIYLNIFYWNKIKKIS